MEKKIIFILVMSGFMVISQLNAQRVISRHRSPVIVRQYTIEQVDLQRDRQELKEFRLLVDDLQHALNRQNYRLMERIQLNLDLAIDREIRQSRRKYRMDVRETQGYSNRRPYPGRGNSGKRDAIRDQRDQFYILNGQLEIQQHLQDLRHRNQRPFATGNTSLALYQDFLYLLEQDILESREEIWEDRQDSRFRNGPNYYQGSRGNLPKHPNRAYPWGGFPPVVIQP